MSHTNQKVDSTTEDDRGDGAQCDVRQDLCEEVHRHSVVATDVFMSVTKTFRNQILAPLQSRMIHCICVTVCVA